MMFAKPENLKNGSREGEGCFVCNLKKLATFL